MPYIRVIKGAIAFTHKAFALGAIGQKMNTHKAYTLQPCHEPGVPVGHIKYAYAEEHRHECR